MMKVIDKLKIGGGITAVVAVIVLVVLVTCGLGRNDDQNWQIKQSITGKVKIIDEPGWYLKAFAKVWTYPRSVQRYFSLSKDEGGTKDESIRVTFNDGGTAQVSTMVRIQTPVLQELRRKAHRDFSGNEENMIQAVRAHMINVIKATGPLMSASEHQSARKAEFTQLVYDQLVNGLYQMRKIEKELKDRTDENGKPITVFATEIVLNEDGQPQIAQASPLDEYGIKVLQFSVTGTEYDQMTRKQFEAKKQSFLLAEKSKAEREQEVQQRLMIVERGLREKAEVEAQANKEKAAATIAANKEKEVATLQAAKKVAVAEQEKLEQEALKAKALVEASREKEVAAIRLEAAEMEAKATERLAMATEKKIQLAGMITEKERVLAEIEKETEIGIAEAYAKVKVPEFIVAGGDGNGADPIKLFGIKMLQEIRGETPAAPVAAK